MALALLAPLLAGCAVPGDGPAAGEGTRGRVVAADGTPVPYAAVVFLQAGHAVALASSDSEGSLAGLRIPPRSDLVQVGAPGFATRVLAPERLAEGVILDADPKGVAPAGALRFDEPVAVVCPTSVYRIVSDLYEPCGAFGEPTMEIAGDGTIWYAAGGGIGTPIWTSSDGGRTFQYLHGNGASAPREAAPTVEGDFGIDAAGNVYFVDTGFASAAVSSWGPTGAFRGSTAWPFLPIVDRPWVKAGREDEVFLTYFTKNSQFTKQPETEAMDTVFYSSQDGGKTWPADPTGKFGCAVGSLGKGPDRMLFVTACGTYWIPSKRMPTLWLSDDAGGTWNDGEAIPLPSLGFPDEARKIHPFIHAVADASGTIFVAFTHNLDAEATENAVFLARRTPNGTWSGPWQVGPGGYNNIPWPAASRDGRVAIAWYHTDTPWSNESDPSSSWSLMAAASIDAYAESPLFQVTVADPVPVLRGPRNDTKLGHLLSTEIMPDGRLAIGYARDIPSTGPRATAQNLFLRSDADIALAAPVYHNGPYDGPAG